VRVIVPLERLLLVDFESKIFFRWHLSVWTELRDLIDHGMPSQARRDVIDPFGSAVDARFKRQSTARGKQPCVFDYRIDDDSRGKPAARHLRAVRVG
jgi:hypothetical protein